MVLRTTDDHVGPESGHLPLAVRAHERVILEEPLVADHHVVVVTLDADLPQRGVAREERRIPAACDEGFNCVTHPA